MALHALPVRHGTWVALQVGLPACEFFYLPGVNRHFNRRRSEVIPQIFNQLQLSAGLESNTDGTGAFII